MNLNQPKRMLKRFMRKFGLGLLCLGLAAMGTGCAIALSSPSPSNSLASNTSTNCITKYESDRDYFPVKTKIKHAIGFDVSAHPDARSKLARDMQERLKMDAEEHARQLAIATAPRCLFVMDADELVRTGGGSGGGGGGGSGGAGGPLLADVAKCKAAEEALGALMADLIRQRDRDAAYVREALPQLMKRANSVEVDLKSLQPHERREREPAHGRFTDPADVHPTIHRRRATLVPAAFRHRCADGKHIARVRHSALRWPTACVAQWRVAHDREGGGGGHCASILPPARRHAHTR